MGHHSLVIQNLLLLPLPAWVGGTVLCVCVVSKIQCYQVQSLSKLQASMVQLACKFEKQGKLTDV